jgi:hypothetical protein
MKTEVRNEQITNLYLSLFLLLWAVLNPAERGRETLAFVLTNNDIPTGAMENLSPDYYETISHNKSAESRSKTLKDHADLSSVVGAWCLSVFRYRNSECKVTEVRT